MPPIFVIVDLTDVIKPYVKMVAVSWIGSPHAEVKDTLKTFRKRFNNSLVPSTVLRMSIITCKRNCKMLDEKARTQHTHIAT